MHRIKHFQKGHKHITYLLNALQNVPKVDLLMTLQINVIQFVFKIMSLGVGNFLFFGSFCSRLAHLRGSVSGYISVEFGRDRQAGKLRN